LKPSSIPSNSQYVFLESEEAEGKVDQELLQRYRLYFQQPVDGDEGEVEGVDCGRGGAVWHPASQVWHRLPHPQRLLPQKDKKPTQGNPPQMQNRYKLYINM